MWLHAALECSQLCRQLGLLAECENETAAEAMEQLRPG